MISYKNISSYRQQLFENKISCSDAVDHFLKKIKEQQHLNAFVEVYEEESMERAKFLDEKRKQGKPCGRLHGVVIALKDVICYKD
ncbi:MAG TPA: amidase family protein, partial [Hanamia sp.]|nr:amidase family protein [Hanamia sp.]